MTKLIKVGSIELERYLQTRLDIGRNDNSTKQNKRFYTCLCAYNINPKGKTNDLNIFTTLDGLRMFNVDCFTRGSHFLGNTRLQVIFEGQGVIEYATISRDEDTRKKRDTDLESLAQEIISNRPSMCARLCSIFTLWGTGGNRATTPDQYPLLQPTESDADSDSDDTEGFSSSNNEHVL